MVKTNKVILSLLLLLFVSGATTLSAQQPHPDYAWTRFLVEPSSAPQGPSAIREADLIQSVAPQMAYLKEVVGTCPQGMKKFHPESPLSNWVADVLRIQTSKVTGIDCDLAIMNFGGIRCDMPVGDVILEDIRSMFPFKNHICAVRVSGERLYSILDSLSRSHWQALSGVEIEYGRSGGIASLKVGGKDFDRSGIYNVATIDFLLEGGDNMYLGRGCLDCRTTDVLLYDAALSFLGDLKQQGRDIHCVCDGRIRPAEGGKVRPQVQNKPRNLKKVPPIPAGKNYSLTILHTNDTHSHIEPERSGNYEGKGGIVGRAALVDSIRRADGRRNVLLLDAGDFEQGSPYFTIFGGKVDIESMNIMGYDAATLGNHEWDNGAEDLRRRMKKARFKTVLCNYEAPQPLLQKMFRPYAIFRRAGKKIGVVGVLADITTLVSSQAGVDLKYLDPTACINKWAEYLKEKKKCDLVIVLSHCGYSGWEKTGPGDVDFAPGLHNVDIIIGGHSHTDLHAPTWIPDADGKPVMIVTDYQYGLYLGEIKL